MADLRTPLWSVERIAVFVGVGARSLRVFWCRDAGQEPEVSAERRWGQARLAALGIREPTGGRARRGLARAVDRAPHNVRDEEHTAAESVRACDGPHASQAIALPQA